MTDRSKIVRHPQVVAAEFESIQRRIRVVEAELRDLNGQLGQVAEIMFEMMMGTGQWHEVKW